jgi:hypothetical protein
MMEAMFGSHFTPVQRSRLILGQTLLYGSAGFPFLSLASEWAKKERGEGSHPDGGVFEMLDRGMFDAAIMATTGQDLMVGDRYGTGSFAGDLFKDIFGFSEFGPKPPAEFLLGATGSIWGQVLSDAWGVKKALDYTSAESGGDIGNPMLESSLKKLASNVSTLSNTFKAYLVGQYGQLKTSTGTTIADNLPSSNAFALMLGIQPGAVDDVSARMGYFKDESEAVDEAAKVIRNYRTDMLNQPDRTEELAAEINIFTKMLPDDIRRKAIKKAHGDIDPSLYTGLAERMERERLSKEGK